MIDLIPPEIKKRKGVRSLVYWIMVVYIVIGAGVILGAVFLQSYSLVGKSSLGDKQTKLDSLMAEKKKNESLGTEAAFIASRVSDAGKYQSVNDWNAVLQAIADATPTDTQLTSLTLASAEGKSATVTVAGTTTSRRSIILFKDRLTVTQPFTAADISNISESDATGSKVFTFSIDVSMTKATTVK